MDIRQDSTVSLEAVGELIDRAGSLESRFVDLSPDDRVARLTKELAGPLTPGLFDIGYSEETGKVLDVLKDLDVFDETIIVITADHGEEFFEHGNKGHDRTLYRRMQKHGIPL